MLVCSELKGQMFRWWQRLQLHHLQGGDQPRLIAAEKLAQSSGSEYFQARYYLFPLGCSASDSNCVIFI